MAKYRMLEEGEEVLIGDEYLQQGGWVRLDETTYQDWIGFSSTYRSDRMCPFRRSLEPNTDDIQKSKRILNKKMAEAMDLRFLVQS